MLGRSSQQEKGKSGPSSKLGGSTRARPTHVHYICISRWRQRISGGKRERLSVPTGKLSGMCDKGAIGKTRSVLAQAARRGAGVPDRDLPLALPGMQADGISAAGLCAAFSVVPTGSCQRSGGEASRGKGLVERIGGVCPGRTGGADDAAVVGVTWGVCGTVAGGDRGGTGAARQRISMAGSTWRSGANLQQGAGAVRSSGTFAGMGQKPLGGTGAIRLERSAACGVAMGQPAGAGATDLRRRASTHFAKWAGGRGQSILEGNLFDPGETPNGR